MGITGPDAENYCLPEKNTVGFAIGQKPVSVEVTVGDKDFDGTRDATVESATLTGVLAGDAVAVQAGKVSFAHAAPGTWEVTLEKLTLTGADAGNYSLTNPQPRITATIRANDRYLDLSQTFPEETEVTVNGKKHIVSTDGGNYLNLPEEAELLTTYVSTDWLENAQTFTPWDGYAGSNCGLYASFQLTGTPEKTIYVNSKLTVLWTAGEVSLVQVDSARYYARTATLTKTPIQTIPTPEAPASEGTGEELWTPPVM